MYFYMRKVSSTYIYTLLVAIFLGPGRFTITSVTFDAGHDLFSVTLVQVSH